MNVKDKITFLISRLNRRDKNLWVFGAWGGEKFADNSKYLYLYALHNTEKKVYWVARDEKIYHQLKEKGYPVIMADDKEGKKIQRRAGVYFFSTWADRDLNEKILGGAKKINLFHGVGPKKVGFDDSINNKQYIGKKNSLLSHIKKPLKNTEFLFTTSPTIRKLFSSSFNLPEEQIFVTGQPRNDVFFNNTLEFDEKPACYVEDRINILYMPTHRKEGKVVFDISKHLDLKEMSDFCEQNNCNFIIKKHFYNSKEATYVPNLPFINDISQKEYDTQVLLKNADILITDYSSCYVDYLLLDKPIVFYVFDMDQYQLDDREFYFDFDQITPGYKLKTPETLLEEIKSIINGVDNNREKRQEVLEIFFGSNRSDSSSRIIHVLHELEN